ncbi:MAG: hypothetical protein ABI298_06465 [Acidimicrobiales bacterium]
MKKFSARGVVALSLIAALGVGTPAVAFADSTTTTTTPTTTTVPVTTTTVKIAHPWEQYRRAENAYLKQLRVINHTFRQTVEVARHDYWLAMKASRHGDNRSTARAAARAALTLSIANAMSARATALTSLGSPPNAPTGAPRSAYIDAIHAINTTYRASVAIADNAFAATFPGATTPAARAQVRATLELSVANAELVRANALTALGPPPVNPVTPVTTTTVPATTTTTA